MNFLNELSKKNPGFRFSNTGIGVIYSSVQQLHWKSFYEIECRKHSTTSMDELERERKIQEQRRGETSYEPVIISITCDETIASW